MFDWFQHFNNFSFSWTRIQQSSDWNFHCTSFIWMISFCIRDFVEREMIFSKLKESDFHDPWANLIQKMPFHSYLWGQIFNLCKNPLERWYVDITTSDKNLISSIDDIYNLSKARICYQISDMYDRVFQTFLYQIVIKNHEKEVFGNW